MSGEDNFLGDPIPLAGPGDSASHASSSGSDIFKTEKPHVEHSSRIKTMSSETALGQRVESQFKRALNPTSRGATRMRTFHAKLGDAAMTYMEQQINEWVDSQDDVVIKFCNTTIGVVEGKRQEPHLIISVWY